MTKLDQFATRQALKQLRTLRSNLGDPKNDPVLWQEAQKLRQEIQALETREAVTAAYLKGPSW